MHNLKLFPSFHATPNASGKDRLFLEQLSRARDESMANFVNFTAYRFTAGESDPIHFITYPLDWVTHYIQSNYMTIDPLMQNDFRHVSAMDWDEIRQSREAQRMLDDFHQRGLGGHGIILTCHVENNLYGVTNYCFDTPDHAWEEFKKQQMPCLRFQSHKITEAYDSIYNERMTRKYNITPREKECLYWVATGKTDEEIGEVLSIGRWTVVSHIRSAKYKLGCANRSAAVAKALTTGIIKLEIDDA